MAFFPAPAPHYSGDLGDIFHYFSKAGRDERVLESQAKIEKLQQFLAQDELMRSAPESYLGAVNPFDFQHRLPTHQAQTGRMGAETDQKRLAFEEAWEPDRSKRAWAGQATNDRRAATDERQVGLQEQDMQHRQAWTAPQYNLDYEKMVADRSQAQSMAAIAAQNANTNQRNVEQDALAQQAATIQGLVAMGAIPQEQAKAFGAFMAQKIMPGFTPPVDPKAEYFRKLAEEGTKGATNERNKNSNAAGQRQSQSAAASGYKEGAKFDREAALYERDQQMKSRAAEAEQLKHQLKYFQELIDNPEAPRHQMDRMRAAVIGPRRRTPVEQRDIAAKAGQLQKNIDELLAPLPEIPELSAPQPVQPNLNPVDALFAPPSMGEFPYKKGWGPLMMYQGSR